MAYTKRNFQREQLLTAEDLNAMDEQIAKNTDDVSNALSIGRNARNVADEARTNAGKANSEALNANAKAEAAIGNSENAIDYAAEAILRARSAENKINSVTEGAITWRRELTASDHLDEIKDTGVYSWLSTNVPQGAPTETGALMIVYKYDWRIVQVVYEVRAVGSTEFDVQQCFRTKFDSESQGWSQWWKDRTPEIVQTVGGRQDAVMSQNAVSGQLELINQRIDGLSREPGEGDTVIGGVDPNVMRVFSQIMTNGVFAADDANGLKPTASDGMKIITNPGTAIINGLSRKDAKMTRTYLVRETEYNDVYLYRLDQVTGEITRLFREVIVHGDILLSKEDGAELPLRMGGYYDILLWKVTIPAGATQITQDMIEDLRPNENYCGFVKLHRSMIAEDWQPAEGGSY